MKHLLLAVFVFSTLCAGMAHAETPQPVTPQPVTPQPAAPHEGIAMNGAPKYSDGFAHFDYVNPDAPKGGEERLNISGTFDTLNPFIVIGQPAARVDNLVYQSLMVRGWEEPFSLYGLIAQSIDVPDDRSSATFTLRPEAHWSDGQPITADDVLFSFTTLRDHGKPTTRTYYKKVEKAEKLGERQVKFTFKPNASGHVDREMPLMIGLMSILPEHVWKNKPFDRTTMDTPIGSGPYKIRACDPSRSVTFVRDPNYWGRDLPEQKGLYNFDTIRIDYFRDESVSIEAFLAQLYDIRREDNPNRWATAYDVPAAHDGRLMLKKFEHHRPEPVEGFIFNTRRDPFRDPALRAALEYTFDSGWINKNLYHSQYHRIESFFPNSELAAPPLPEGKELDMLNAYRAQLPPEIFSAPVTPPSTDGSEESLRKNLLIAAELLRKAGYVLRDDKLYAPGAVKSVSFEIILNDPGKKQIAMTWTRALDRLGIRATVSNPLDSAAFQARLSTFNYDVVITKWISTLSPGNEQIVYWGSAAADQQGSRNYAGVRDPVVDALATAIPETVTREDLVATAHALDRVLMAGHYVVPFYYLGADNYAFWTAHLRYPAETPLWGTVLESWWSE